jgi:CRISPR-associated protein Cmr1
METITFTCKVITPMFLSGADGQTPELRAPSIKGAMRFWWRAMHGELVQLKENSWNFDKLKTKETEIFGGTKDGGRSRFSIQIRQSESFTNREKLVPHDANKGLKPSFSPNKQKFELIIRCHHSDKQMLQVLFTLTSVLGGIGKRSRRGMGAFSIERVMQGDKEMENLYPKNISELWHLMKKLEDIDSFNIVDGNKIINSLKIRPQFPFIREIQWGKADSNILYKISDTTHRMKHEYPQAYEILCGSTRNGRFASPVYVTILEGNVPLIITLNPVPHRGNDTINHNLHSDFKNNIL